ncbi:hypothetical protein LTR12_014206 [Friedmanniomyces endolithicus]|nr:hypothetical protein LTR12_014206 [Friedmanniomyces endolithicus]
MQHNTFHEQADIKLRHDLTDLCEAEDTETGAVLRSTFTIVDADDIVWVGQNLRRIPDDTVYPEVMPGLTIIADDEGPELLYIKRPNSRVLTMRKRLG